MAMMDVLLWMAVACWTWFLLLGIINALLVRNIARVAPPAPPHWPFVSYVVPARNEEQGIRSAVTSFCTQDYPGPFEVIVVNDRSTDQTPRILAELQSQFANLAVVEGEEPPPGWFGKPYALQTAERHARGEWILMADADAVHAPDLLRRGMAYAIREKAAMLAIRPRHITGSILEAVLMSGVNFFFFVATPIFLVRHSRSAVFATGSPVFNLIQRDVLDLLGGFACLKQALVDDLEIGFQVKRAGQRVAVAFAGSLIQHRMYRGAQETVQGFGKNTFPSIRRAPWLLPLYYLVGATISILPYGGFLLGLQAGQINVPATIALVMMHTVFAGFAWRYGEPWYITFLNPIREMGWLWIFTRSFFVYRRNGLVWRGRSYQGS
jgi:glycosyltransferase involved in cell wall biosynthesis